MIAQEIHLPNGKLPGKKFLTGNLMSAVQKAQKLTPTAHRRKKKSKVIDELKVFDNELEMQAEYSGFSDLFHSFDLYRGKVNLLLVLIS